MTPYACERRDLSYIPSLYEAKDGGCANKQSAASGERPSRWTTRQFVVSDGLPQCQQLPPHCRQAEPPPCRSCTSRCPTRCRAPPAQLVCRHCGSAAARWSSARSCGSCLYSSRRARRRRLGLSREACAATSGLRHRGRPDQNRLRDHERRGRRPCSRTRARFSACGFYRRGAEGIPVC